MSRYSGVLLVAMVALAFSACGEKPAATKAAAPAPVAEARPETAPAPAAEPVKQAEQQAAASAAEAERAADPEKAAEAPAADESPDDPDEDSAWDDSKAANVDRDKLAKAYQEVYCAQKKGEMDKLLDIYKANGFEKPEDFISTWVEVARDTAWVTKVATDAASRCK